MLESSWDRAIRRTRETCGQMQELNCVVVPPNPRENLTSVLLSYLLIYWNMRGQTLS